MVTRALYLLISLLLTSCSHVFYQPSSALFFNPEKANLHPEELWIESSDATRIHAWLFPAKTASGNKLGTVIQFHGNAENMSSHFASLIWMTEAGYDLLAFDYRGYGTSEGSPNQAGLNRDALAVIESLNKEGKEKKIILYGQSLGGAVLLRALQDLTDRSRIKAVIIESSFYSYQAIARAKLAQTWLTFIFQPLAWVLVSDQYSPEESIAKVSPIPLLVMHGDRDQVIPYRFGEKIFQLAHEPKTFWKIENGHHLDTMARHGGIYREKLIQFLAELPN